MSKLSKTEKIALCMLAMYLLFRFLWAIVGDLGFFDKDNEQEIRFYEQKRDEILNRRTPTEIDKVNRYEDLRELARSVGAGAENTVVGTPYPDPRDERATIIPHTIISESELVNNINMALQTKSTIYAQKQATNSNIISIFALLLSIIAALGSGFAFFYSKRK